MRKFILILPLILGGCVLPNNARQTGPAHVEHKPQIHLPAPKITVKEVNTDKLVEDTATRIKADQSANNAQLSGHITAQLHKLEADLSNLIKIENTINSKVSAELTAKLEASLKLLLTMNVHLENQVKITTELRAKLEATVMADVTSAGYAGEINKTMQSIKEDIKASAGRDVNLFPPAAVEAIKASYENANNSIGWIYKGLIALLLVIKVVALAVLKRAYDNAKARQDNYAKLLMKAMGELEPHRASEFKKELG